MSDKHWPNCAALEGGVCYCDAEPHPDAVPVGYRWYRPHEPTCAYWNQKACDCGAKLRRITEDDGWDDFTPWGSEYGKRLADNQGGRN